MNQPNAITELQRLAEIITEQDLRMMISHGGANSAYQYIQLAIGARVEQLQQMEETLK
ncbi:hypothetical protein [Alishewanella sp. WH16-1]|uniref:hypothetical protein n=1 Tax=Alishewanella sp. WH16-1 TaxID=1651088 RepID=UPI000A5D3291|nr:hypothetical protein [Alishewanella sp. WH16-1]